jgi:proteasome lid subunit RPN8/RPN11
MILSEENKAIIKQQALRENPNECCGLVYLEGNSPTAVPLKNVDADPANFFTIDPKDYLKTSLLGKIQGYYHSHIKESAFSDFDLLMAEKLNLTAVMYCLADDKFYEYSPIGRELPFVGRQYVTGAIDCFSLVRDYYNKIYNIILPDFENEYRLIEHKPDHPDNDRCHNVLPEYFEKNGFTKVSEVKEGDVILMNTPNILSPVHCCIYKEHNQILHHPFGKKSNISLYKDIHKKYATHIFRHKALL